MQHAVEAQWTGHKRDIQTVLTFRFTISHKACSSAGCQWAGRTRNPTTQYTFTWTINSRQAWKVHKGPVWERAAGMYANAMKLSQISGLSNHISKTRPSEALLICARVCLCVYAHVWCPVTALPNGWASKLSNQALLNPCFPSSLPVYVSYLLGQSCCRPSDFLILRLLGGLWTARSQPTTGGLGHPLLTAPDGCKGIVWLERGKEKVREPTSNMAQYSAFTVTALLISFLPHQRQIDVRSHSACSRLWSSRSAQAPINNRKT